MIDPQTVMIGSPSRSGTHQTELMGMLIQNRDLFAAYTLPTECSHPSLARNLMADTFLRSQFEWFVGIDDDIVPQRPDFLLMLQETNPDTHYALPDVMPADNFDAHGQLCPPQPTRVEVPLQRRPGEFNAERALADVLVCAEYARRNDPFEPVQFGCGFYRVHRSVFSMLRQLTHEDTGRVEVDRALLDRVLETHQEDGWNEWSTTVAQLQKSMTSQAGLPLIWQCTHKGQLFHDYFPDGSAIGSLIPKGEWRGEDHGFWTLCQLAGLIPRIEKRTRLLHIGRKAYPYPGNIPDSHEMIRDLSHP